MFRISDCLRIFGLAAGRWTIWRRGKHACKRVVGWPVPSDSPARFSKYSFAIYLWWYFSPLLLCVQPCFSAFNQESGYPDFVSNARKVPSATSFSLRLFQSHDNCHGRRYQHSEEPFSALASRTSRARIVEVFLIAAIFSSTMLPGDQR